MNFDHDYTEKMSEVFATTHAGNIGRKFDLPSVRAISKDGKAF